MCVCACVRAYMHGRRACTCVVKYSLSAWLMDGCATLQVVTLRRVASHQYLGTL